MHVWCECPVLLLAPDLAPPLGVHLRAELPRALELVLAGGLNPANVARAIGLLRPDVVDVSSGVEAALGEKSPAAVHAFVTAARVAALGADPVNAQES